MWIECFYLLISLQLSPIYKKLNSWWNSSRSKCLFYLNLPPHGCPGVPDIVRHLVTEEPLDMLGLDPVRVLAVHGLPGGVVEPGAPHDLQPRTRPVHRVTLPFPKIHLEDPAPDHDEEVPLVPDDLGVWPVVSLGVSGGQVRREFPARRMTVIECPVPDIRVMEVLLGITQVIFVTATAVAISSAPVIVPARDNVGLNILFETLLWF